MIIMLSDTDGDDVAVDARSIVAVTVGDLRGQPVALDARDGNDGARPHRVTLVHTAAGPLVVSQSLEQVVHAWQGALCAADALDGLARAEVALERLEAVTAELREGSDAP